MVNDDGRDEEREDERGRENKCGCERSKTRIKSVRKTASVFFELHSFIRSISISTIWRRA